MKTASRIYLYTKTKGERRHYHMVHTVGKERTSMLKIILGEYIVVPGPKKYKHVGSKTMKQIRSLYKAH